MVKLVLVQHLVTFHINLIILGFGLFSFIFPVFFMTKEVQKVTDLNILQPPALKIVQEIINYENQFTSLGQNSILRINQFFL